MARIDVVTGNYAAFVNSVFGTDFVEMTYPPNTDEASYKKQISIAVDNQNKWSKYYKEGRFGQWTNFLEPLIIRNGRPYPLFTQYSGEMDWAVDKIAAMLARAVDLCPDPNAMAVISIVPRAGSNFYYPAFAYRMTNPEFSYFLGQALREHGFTGEVVTTQASMNSQRFALYTYGGCPGFRHRKKSATQYISTWQSECPGCRCTAYTYRGRDIISFVSSRALGVTKSMAGANGYFSFFVLIHKLAEQQPPTLPPVQPPPNYPPPPVNPPINVKNGSKTGPMENKVLLWVVLGLGALVALALVMD